MTQVERNELEQIKSPPFRIGKYFPNHQNPLTNLIIAEWKVLTRSGEPLTEQAIQERVGIKLRYVASKDQTVIDMGVEAAKDALKGERNIDFVIVSTSFPGGVHIASEIAQRLELPKIIPQDPACVLDVYAACSGFVRGLGWIKEHDGKFQGKRILFVATEKYSDKVVDLKQDGALAIDSSLAQTIFSDGAIALVFTYGQDIEILASKTRQFDHIRGIIQMPVDESQMVEPYFYELVDKSPDYFRQQGPRVFREVLMGIPPFTQECLEKTGIDLSEVQHIVPHQGSGRIVAQLKEQFGKLFKKDIPVADDMEEGNFSSGSVPKALAKLQENGEIDPRKVILLVGFGAGAGLLASIAAVIIKGTRKN